MMQYNPSLGRFANRTSLFVDVLLDSADRAAFEFWATVGTLRTWVCALLAPIPAPQPAKSAKAAASAEIRNPASAAH
jgi:hypothetical protein